MKGDKKILLVALLLLLLSVSFTTYAIYKSSATGSATVGTAAWVVKVNTRDIVANNDFTVGDITWNTPRQSKNAAKIAPGDSGTIDVVIDATGAEVDVDYAITLNSSSITNNRITLAADTGSSLTGTITAGQSVTVKVKVNWDWVDDDTTANPGDVETAGTELTVPITVTATQHRQTS